MKGGAEERNERDEEVFLGGWRDPFLSRGRGGECSLSVAGELAGSSTSPEILLPPPFVEAEPETRLTDDELALKFFSLCFSFSSKSMNIRERASL